MDAAYRYIRQHHLALLALFFALSGSAIAVQNSRNTVGSKEIKPKSVKRSDLARNSVDSSKVLDGSLKSQDFERDVLLTGPAGAPGRNGSTGPPGPTFGANQPGLFSPDALETDGVGPLISEVEFSTPTSGRVFVTTYTTGLSVNCTPDASPVAGLYVDGQPLPGTRRNMLDSVAEDFQASSISAIIPAGQHTAQIGASCPGPGSVPTSIGANDAERSLSVIFLGS